MSRRTERVNELLRTELSKLIQRNVKDPRIAEGLTSITEVQVAPDLRNAVVYISHLGRPEERDDVLAGLARASHFLQAELRHRLAMRAVPGLHFRFDPSIERGARLASLINEVAVPPAADPAAASGTDPLAAPRNDGGALDERDEGDDFDEFDDDEGEDGEDDEDDEDDEDAD